MRKLDEQRAILQSVASEPEIEHRPDCNDNSPTVAKSLVNQQLGWRARQGSCPVAASLRAAACLSTAGRRHLAQRDGAPGRGRTCDPRLRRSAPVLTPDSE